MAKGVGIQGDACGKQGGNARGECRVGRGDWPASTGLAGGCQEIKFLPCFSTTSQALVFSFSPIGELLRLCRFSC